MKRKESPAAAKQRVLAAIMALSAEESADLDKAAADIKARFAGKRNKLLDTLPSDDRQAVRDAAARAQEALT